MKKFFLLFLPLFLLSLAPRTSVLVKTDIYTVNYSETYQQPLSVEYTVLCPNGTASRKGMDFYTNDSIITSDNADYENNVYDKGHMAPAADFTCSTEMLRKTFSYLNCALQDQYLNRGTWRFLEAEERRLSAGKEKAKVLIKLEYKNPIKLATGATVPSGFYKRIIVGKDTSMYYFPNSKPKSSDFKEFKIKSWPKN
jgi:endonuclease G, mitochondrial